MSPSGLVISRLVKLDPAPVVTVRTVLPPTNRSVALLVDAAPLLLVAFVPVAPTTTSSGLEGSSPLYSKIRTSGLPAATLKVTVTVFAFAAAAAMLFA
jgi:hypothetical protein